MIEGFEGNTAKDGPNKGQRTVNGWKNSALPWTYELDKDEIYLHRQAACGRISASICTPGLRRARFGKPADKDIRHGCHHAGGLTNFNVMRVDSPTSL